MTPRRAFLLALVIAASLAWWLARGGPPRGAAVDPGPEIAAPEAAPARSGLADAASAVEARESLAPAAGPAAADAVPIPAEPPPPAHAGRSDRGERREVDLVVENRHGEPIEGAEIVMTGLRTKREPGSHHAWGEETSLGRTRADGTARLWFPVWTTRDDETGELTFRVSHPAYVTKVVDRYVIDGEPRVVVLDPGAMVIVSGWSASRADVVLDVEPHLAIGTDVARADWLPIRDGRLSTVKLAPGRHALWLSHESARRGRLFSAIEAFDLAEGEQKELHLELLPGSELRGRLEDEVPRPVSGGEVLLNLQFGLGSDRGPRMMRSYSAPIGSDGSFAFVDLPPGDGQVIALCDGWSSERVVTRDPEWLGVAGEDLSGDALEAAIDRAIERLGDRARVAQPVAPGTTKEFVLRMEPTATLRVTLRAPGGEPAAGAKVSCWPNVFWRSGFSQVFLNREYGAVSDAAGVATVANLPPGEAWFGVEHATLDVPNAPGEGDRARRAGLRAGETLEVELALEGR